MDPDAALIAPSVAREQLAVEHARRSAGPTSGRRRGWRLAATRGCSGAPARARSSRRSAHRRRRDRAPGRGRRAPSSGRPRGRGSSWSAIGNSSRITSRDPQHGRAACSRGSGAPLRSSAQRGLRVDLAEADRHVPCAVVQPPLARRSRSRTRSSRDPGCDARSRRCGCGALRLPLEGALSLLGAGHAIRRGVVQVCPDGDGRRPERACHRHRRRRFGSREGLGSSTSQVGAFVGELTAAEPARLRARSDPRPDRRGRRRADPGCRSASAFRRSSVRACSPRTRRRTSVPAGRGWQSRTARAAPRPAGRRRQ